MPLQTLPPRYAYAHQHRLMQASSHVNIVLCLHRLMQASSHVNIISCQHRLTSTLLLLLLSVIYLGKLLTGPLEMKVKSGLRWESTNKYLYKNARTLCKTWFRHCKHHVHYY